MPRRIEPLPFLPAGVTVDVTVTFPKEHGGMGEGLRWKAPAPVSAEEARREIGRDLFTVVLDQLLLSPVKEP